MPKYTRQVFGCEPNVGKLWAQTMKGASDRNLEFNLDYDDFEAAIREPCYYCGRYRDDKCWSGLDRIDNGQGYTIDNIVPACWYCNRAKSTLGFAEFMEWLSDICAWAGKERD